MDTSNIIPDAPFRSGTTGKYKLMIRSVTPRFNGYEYELVDADGKEYKAASPKHYAPDQVLRCMVHFKVVKAAFVVTETLICSKQDFATAIPEPPKPQLKPKPEARTKSSVNKAKASTEPKREHLGDPHLKRVPGKYVLRVAAVKQSDAAYSYKVEDAKGRLYEVKAKQSYPVGCIVDCRVQVSNAPSGAMRVSVLSINKHTIKTVQSKRKHKRGNPLKHWHAGGSSYDWPSPSSGVHFHLIYTPMGNKR